MSRDLYSWDFEVPDLATITMDFTLAEDSGRHYVIALGYPSPQALTGQDPRSDERILRSLQSAGKLKQ